jgi:hypothetical protein
MKTLIVALMFTAIAGSAQAQQVDVLLGTQIGTRLNVETSSGMRLQYSDARYVADAPNYWTTKRWSVDVGQRVGDVTVYAGYVNLDYQPIGSGWTLAYSDIELGARADWWDVALRSNGFDVSVKWALSPSITVGYINWRYFGGSVNCDPYCQWSGPTISVSF